MISPAGIRSWTVLRSIALAAVVPCLGGCGGDAPWDGSAPLLAADGEPAVTVVLPAGASAGLLAAAQDLSAAMQAIGAPSSEPLPPVVGDLEDAPTRAVVWVQVEPELQADLGAEGHRVGPFARDGKQGLHLLAATPAGAMYGLYTIVADLGVRYIHPEQTYTPPADPEARLPWREQDATVEPHFAVRGFHEHTQHPIPASDFYLRPDAGLGALASSHLRWLARNRQSFVSFQLLKTVGLDAWRPYVERIIGEAHGLHLHVGLVLSFVDEQQNSYKLVRYDRSDASGEPVPAEQQIEEDLEAFAALGFDAITVQLGSSEFTKPDETRVVAWLDLAAKTLARHGVPLYAWVHNLCSLKTESGGYFYHLPLQADAAVGAWVHTTMFYTLEHPAPVYGCDSFAQQRAFLQQADGKRAQIFFPETAWWLGFDNNLPLALPLTGWSRAHDIRETTAAFDLQGHVTFTTGREWGYWQYDHYLTRATWDASVGWEDYLQWLAPVFGEHGGLLADVLQEWTELQRQHFYVANPSIYFYLAGELPQDEIGEVVDILARPPKLGFGKLLGYDDETFAAWKQNDYQLLLKMKDQYGELLARLPASTPKEGDLSTQLYHETAEVLRVYTLRIEHALQLYAGVEAARSWVRDQDAAGKAAAQTAAEERLAAARAITAEVKQAVAAMEPYYRYPVELLARTKRASLTTYPFGYLFETFTGLFWQRRDDQLAVLIERVFSDSTDAWSRVPEHLFVTGAKLTELVVPDDPVAGTIIGGFTPTMLFGLYGDLAGDGEAHLVVAHDANGNLLPDTGTELDLPLDKTAEPWTATADEYVIRVRSSSGELLGDGLTVYQSRFAVDVGPDPLNPTLPELRGCTLAGQIASAELVDLVVGVSGIDAAGAESLVRSVFGVPPAEPTPERLPIKMALRFERAQTI